MYNTRKRKNKIKIRIIIIIIIIKPTKISFFFAFLRNLCFKAAWAVGLLKGS